MEENNKLLESLCAELKTRMRQCTASIAVEEDSQIESYYVGKRDGYNELLLLLNSFRNGQAENK